MPENNSKLKVLDLFSGIQVGGFSLGLERTGGFETVAFCEIEEFPRKVLKKHWPEVPCYHDVTTANFEHLGPVDLVTAGFPCQDASLAGKGAGIAGSRTGLFWHVLRTIRVVGQPGLLLENVAALLGRGMGTVLGALAQIGYDAEWNCFPAAAIGAPQSRDRLWIIANARKEGQQGPVIEWDAISCRNVSEITKLGNYSATCGAEWTRSFPLVSMGNGLSSKLVRDGVGAAGNAVVPQIPELIGHAILEARREVAA